MLDPVSVGVWEREEEIIVWALRAAVVDEGLVLEEAVLVVVLSVVDEDDVVVVPEVGELVDVVLFPVLEPLLPFVPELVLGFVLLLVLDVVPLPPLVPELVEEEVEAIPAESSSMVACILVMGVEM